MRTHGGHAATHLAPQKFSNPDEETPQPLGQVELSATEGLAPKLHDENLEWRRGSLPSAGGKLALQPRSWEPCHLPARTSALRRADRATGVILTGHPDGVADAVPRLLTRERSELKGSGGSL